MQTYHIHTFGCQQNTADSERIASLYESRGFVRTEEADAADVLILNTCVVRDRAEEKVYGLVRSMEQRLAKAGKPLPHIVVTGCLVGAAARVPGGKMMKRLTSRLPMAEFLPMEEVGFEHLPKREMSASRRMASIVISNGCNNYCAYCIVPFSRGKEISRSFEDIIAEAERAAAEGYDEVVLLGQNVNSYGADLLMEKMKEQEAYVLSDGTEVKPVMVKHLNRHRIPTLFPYLLERVAKIPGLEKVSFLSSNPWDFSDELIDVIAQNTNIVRLLHLPIQAGSDRTLKNMNRWYTVEEYLALIDRIRAKVPEARFTTDIIVGFPGETREEFEETVALAKKVGFEKAYVAWYSPRPGTAAAEKMQDDVPIEEKQRRFRELDAVTYKPGISQK